MKSATRVYFPPFQLDATNEQLWRMTSRGAEVVRLRPKTFAVLHYLLEHHQQLVTKEQLLSTLWPGTWVTDSALKSCVRELRKALKDTLKAPRFIETVHRRGYRFIAPVTTTPSPVQSSTFKVPRSDIQHSLLVGRETEFTQLHQWLEKAVSGERQLVFVTGEPGIGKTTLVDAFLTGIRQQGIGNGQQRNTNLSQLFPDARSPMPSLWMSWGQCIEHYGAGEPYMPIFEALSRLCRAPAGRAILDILSQHAPSWLVQMPSLLQAAELEKLRRQVHGATPERMLREIVETLEVITNERPLILVLEDLHWSDTATLELLTMLARRRERARLLVLATYRSADREVEHYPLRNVLDELQLHGHSHLLPVGFLTRSHIAKYLSQRFPGNIFSSSLAEVLHQRTNGNPLFMVSIVDEFVRRSRIKGGNGQWTLSLPTEQEGVGVPDNLRQTIARQIAELDQTERRILETASVVNVEFSSAAVASMLTEDIEAVETLCDALVRRGRFLQAAASTEGPDGVPAAHYRFVHVLYREVLYNQLALNKRVRLHKRIGAWQEAVYGEQAREIAGELALHFERGCDYQRAVHYHQQAGENALQRSAPREALAHFDVGLGLLPKLSPSHERLERDLTLQIARIAPLGTVYGYGSPQIAEACNRAHQLCQQVHESPQLVLVLGFLASVLHMRGNLRRAHALEGQLLRIARRASKRTLLLWAYFLQGATAYNRGQLSRAQRSLKAALQFYDPRRHNPLASGGREDPGLLSYITLVSTLWLLGYPDQALQKLGEVQSLVEPSADPLSRVMLLGPAAVLHQRRREGRAALASANEFFTLAQEQGFSFRAATGMVYRGWALAACGDIKEGIIQIRTGLEAIDKTGALLARPYYLALLGEVYSKAEQFDDALRVLKEALALAQTNDDRFYEAEIWRLRGELLLHLKTKKESSHQMIESSSSQQI